MYLLRLFFLHVAIVVFRKLPILAEAVRLPDEYEDILKMLSQINSQRQQNWRYEKPWVMSLVRIWNEEFFFSPLKSTSNRIEFRWFISQTMTSILGILLAMRCAIAQHSSRIATAILMRQRTHPTPYLSSARLGRSPSLFWRITEVIVFAYRWPERFGITHADEALLTLVVTKEIYTLLLNSSSNFLNQVTEYSWVKASLFTRQGK